jgi:putative N6-adenine-specific DNA methylase
MMIRPRTLYALKTVENRTPETSLSKRTKRHVTGREKEFFAATSPGLESLCLNELKTIAETGKEIIETEGGVQFTGRITDCFSANLNLRTANRILMRIGEFKATNFLQLEKKLSDFPWELYLPADSRPEINSATKHSRLYHKDAIAEIFTSSIGKSLASTGFAQAAQDPSIPQQVFVRVVNDRFTISLDSSGELLYKRGIKKHRAKAPLRETTAAAILKLSGYDGSEPLLDPMCGSGTFSLEAAMISQNIPAGWFRNFAFMNWPCFGPKKWAYIKRKAESGVKLISSPHIFASDIDSGACDSLISCINKYDIFKTVEVAQKDFFDLTPHALTKDKGLVVINPPYGHRMGSRQESINLFNEICRKLKNDFAGWKVALIAPDVNIAEKSPFGLKAATLFHGGLRISLLYGRI